MSSLPSHLAALFADDFVFPHAHPRELAERLYNNIQRSRTRILEPQLSEVLIFSGTISPRIVSALPFYLCDNCARDRIKLDLTYAGINQLWLRTSPNPEGFGPPCDFCSAPKTIYQVQIIGTSFDTEGQHLEKMKAEMKPTT